MRILIACDSFKGSLTSLEVGNILKESLEEKNNVEAHIIPISDGGEGFLDAIEHNIDTDRYTTQSVNALGKKNIATYLFKNEVAYLELAEVVGIKDLKKEELSVYHANTYGLGLLIKEVIEKHQPKKIVIGLGGSASTDGGSGMLEALGAKFYIDNKLINNIDNEKLGLIDSVDLEEVYQKTKDIEFLILTDVTNPLLKQNGAAYIFGEQKGATKEDLPILDSNLEHFVGVLKDTKCHQMPGSGAAGGTGFGCLFAFKGIVEQGIKYLLELINFEELSKQYDYVITGEGKFDNQSKMGKVYQGIYNLLDNKDKLLVVCAINETSDSNVYSIVPDVATKEESLLNPIESLKKLVKEKLQLL